MYIKKKKSWYADLISKPREDELEILIKDKIKIPLSPRGEMGKALIDKGFRTCYLLVGRKRAGNDVFLVQIKRYGKTELNFSDLDFLQARIEILKTKEGFLMSDSKKIKKAVS